MTVLTDSYDSYLHSAQGMTVYYHCLSDGLINVDYVDNLAHGTQNLPFSLGIVVVLVIAGDLHYEQNTMVLSCSRV